MLGHLWYLSENLVGMAFFDISVPNSTKAKMVEALMQNKGTEEPLKRAVVDPANIQSKELEDFVTTNTSHFFEYLGIQTTFLAKDPSEWKDDSDYCAGE
jgi:hypothetical protein